MFRALFQVFLWFLGQLLKVAPETIKTLEKEHETLNSDVLNKLKPKGNDTIEAAIANRLNATQAQAWSQ